MHLTLYLVHIILAILYHRVEYLRYSPLLPVFSISSILHYFRVFLKELKIKQVYFFKGYEIRDF